MEDGEPDRKQSNLRETMSAYPLYDVPWLVRDPNDFRMSRKRKKYDFLQKFPPEKEHIVHFDIIFAPDLELG